MRTSAPRSRTRKTPTRGRCLLAATALLVGGAQPLLAEDPLAGLTESEAVERALSRPGIVEMWSGEVGRARSEATRAALLPNPVAGYAREQTFGGDEASAENYAWVLQKLDLSGRRGLRTEAAQRQVEATEDDVRSDRRALRAEIRARFYDVMQRQRRVEAVRQWSARLALVAERTARRAAAGDAAAYDRQRAAREHAASVARCAIEEAGLARASEQLAALVTDQAPATAAGPVVGELLPETPPADLETILARLPARPDLRALDAAADAAELQQRASARWWLPEVEIGAGYKGVEMADERLNGFTATGAIPLPLLNRNQDDAMRAAADAQIARGRRRTELAAAAGELRGVHAQATQRAAAARQVRAAEGPDPRALAQTAEAAYHGGEGGILELVDAYRVQLDAELQIVDLEWRARRARIELDRLSEEDPS